MAEKTIHNIVFDYGNVVINLDVDATYQAFESIGASRFSDDWDEIMESKLFQKYERGDISTPDFRSILRRAFDCDISDDKIDWAWNQILKDMPNTRIQLLKDIRAHYRTFLLSNSNDVHYHYYLNDLQQQHQIKSFDVLFEKAYFSFQLNMIKPEPEFYEKVLFNHNLNANETLFIDDLKQNIDAASTLGIHTIWMKKGMDICDLFNENCQLNEFAFAKMDLV
jgi:putative hydrolase of the HAD superfamily